MTDPAAPPSLDQLLLHRAWVRSLALSLAGDEHSAADLEQSAWLRLIERPDTALRSPGAWFATVLRNLARDAGRSAPRRRERERAAARPDAQPSAHDVVARADAHQRVTRAVLALPDPFRTVVLMRFFDDLPPREIAAALGVPPATVRSRLHRGLALLREGLETSDPRGLGAALLPLLAAPPRAGGGAVALLEGGLVVSTKKKITLVVIALLLLLGAAWTLGPGRAPRGVAFSDSQEPARDVAAARRTTLPAGPRAEAPAAVVVPEDEPSDPAGSAPRRTSRALEPQLLRPAGGQRSTHADEREPEDPEPGVEILTHGGGAVETVETSGIWADAPPHGDVRLRGRVVDLHGRPLPGAWVFHIEVDEAGRPRRMGRWIFARKVAETGADGAFDVPEMPAGSYWLQADFGGRNRVDGDLLLDDAPLLRVRDGQTLDGITLRVPVDPTVLATVEGEVFDRHGRPLSGELVHAGRSSDWVRPDGSFRIPRLEPGRMVVRTEFGGAVNEERVVDVGPGGTARVRFELAYATQGALDLSVRVVDSHGAPVTGAVLYLGVGDDDDRSGRTDAEGRYHFTRLPASCGTSPKKLFVMNASDTGDRFENTHLDDLKLPSPDIEIVVRLLTTIRLRVHDQLSGEPVQFVNWRLRPESEAAPALDPTLAGRDRWSREGEFELRSPAGRFVLTVHGKGHRSIEAILDVPDDPGPFTLDIALTPQ